MPEVVPDSKNVGRAAWESLQKRHRDWSVDELLLHPSIGVEVCRDVRRRLGKRLDDDQILRALLNCRKQGLLKGVSR